MYKVIVERMFDEYVEGTYTNLKEAQETVKSFNCWKEGGDENCYIEKVTD